MPTPLLRGACLLLALSLAPKLYAQDTALPDAPSASLAQTAQPSPKAPADRPYAKFILPGEPAPRLGFRGKFVFGVKDAVSIASGVAWIVNAGFVQATNGKPHYGTDRGAFAARFGAAALRDTTEDIISESMLAPLVHQDPRYYILGKHHSFVRRLAYAATRTVVTRTDSGNLAPNLWLLGGDFAGAALTNTYYPHVDGGVIKTAQIFAGSVGGSALDFIFSEFLSGIYDLIHSKSASQ